MKGKAFLIPLVLMVVGFATVSTSLSINGIANVYNELDGYDVYFSDVRVDGVQDWTTVDNKTVLTFTPDFDDGDYVLEYDVTNASEQYDSNVNVTCVSDNNNLVLNNQFDSSTILKSHDTRTGSLTVSSKWTFTDVDGDGTVSVGDVYSFENEKFNVISFNDQTITMLAQQNLSSSYRQSATENYVYFSDVGGWDLGVDIDFQNYVGSAKTYISAYESYLVSATGDSNLKASLITLSQLQDLGCSTSSCAYSPNASWLVTTYRWWTRTAVSNRESRILGVIPDGVIYDDYSINTYGLRPTVTISRSASLTCFVESTPVETDKKGDGNYPGPVEKVCKWKYTDTDGSYTVSVGDEYALCDEKFNVINVGDTSVDLLAQYNISTDFEQTTETNYMTIDMETQPDTLDALLGNLTPDALTYVTSYVDYLQNISRDDTITGNLITLSELSSLGCTGINADYSFNADGTCENSAYVSWLLNKQFWWTRSFSSKIASNLYFVYPSGALMTPIQDWDFDNTAGIRPTITVSKDNLPQPEVSLISFTIDNITYNSVAGWDWDTWIKSDFNTIGITYHDCGAISGSTGHVFSKSDYMEVSSTTTIIDGGSYFIAGMFHCMPED